MTDGSEAIHGNTASIGARDVYYNYLGLTKREYFAAMAMQGMLANSAESPYYDNIVTGSESAVASADALIAALNK